MSRRPFLSALAGLLALAAPLAGCMSERPYLFSDYRYHQRGQVIICYSARDSKPEEVKVLADDICRQYDRMAVLALEQGNQCSWTAPDEAFFACVPRPGETPAPIVERKSPMRHDPRLPPP